MTPRRRHTDFQPDRPDHDLVRGFRQPKRGHWQYEYAQFRSLLAERPRIEWSLIASLALFVVGSLLHWLPLTWGFLPLFGMVQIGVGNAPGDGLGDTRRVGMQKVNQYAFLNDYTVSAQSKVFAGATIEISISNAVAACVTNGWTAVWVGASWLPYAAENVTFNASVHMYAEGHADDGVFDVEAYGGDPRGYASTATSTVAAINACHSAIPTSGPVGGTIFFGPGNFLINAVVTFTKHNVTVKGSGGWTPGAALFTTTMISNNAGTTPINGPMLVASGGICNFQAYDFGVYGPGVAYTSSKGLTINDAAGDFILEHLYFNGFGLHGIQTGATTATIGGTITACMGENCLLSLPGTDQGVFDTNSSDLRMEKCFATPSISSGAGNLGTGHCFAYAIRGANGFFKSNMAELAHRGWLVTSTTGLNRFETCRSFLTQAEGWVISGGPGNLFLGCGAISASQDTDNTYAGFNTTGSGNVFGICYVNGLGGDARQAKYGFIDNNSAGGSDADATANHYSNGKAGSSVRGQLYFQSGTNCMRVDHPHRVSPDKGDAAGSFTPYVDAETVMYQTALTASRTFTINGSSLNYPKGTRCRVVRTAAATGAFPLVVTATGGDSTNLGVNKFVDFEIDNGSIFRIVGGGSCTDMEVVQTPTEAVLVSGISTMAGLVVKVTITAARVIGAPLHPVVGQRLTFVLIQNATGGFAVTLNAVFKGPFSNVGNTANLRSGASYIYDGTNWNQDSAQSLWA